jgi:hypothetical protein
MPLLRRRQLDRVTVPRTLVVLLLVTAGCTGAPDTALERQTESRRLAADLLIQLTKAADAANRAVMADTDDTSTAFAREAEQATAAIEKDVDALRPTLDGLGYTSETRLLDEFAKRFAEYRTLDRNILDLAVENTNLKAQRLSFGPARQAADGFRDALNALAPASPQDAWRVEALAAMAVARVREIQVLQAPHIAEADDAAMTDLEKRMAASEAAARTALQSLAPLVAAAARPRLAAATTALDRFMVLNAELITLSQHKRPITGALARPEADAHRGVRGKPGGPARVAGQARIRRHALTDATFSPDTARRARG